MINITKFKELLGDYAKTLSDEEVEKIRRDMYILADTAFDFWEKDKALKNSQAKKDML